MGLDPDLVDGLWQESEASACGLSRNEFNEILTAVGQAQNFGEPLGSTASREEQAAFFRSLRLADLVLAQACARGLERAWERFLALYREPLTRAAIAISGSDTTGRDLADALYAELYGLTTRNEQRRCPLASYRGRGSLLGWLRTTLAQRHVDHHRRTWRGEPLENSANQSDISGGFDPPAAEPEQAPNPGELSVLAQAVAEALAQRPPEDRFLLASYFLDGRTLLEIGSMLRVHEATVSRKLHRLARDLRQQLLRNLQNRGLSKRAAEEALETDPRDISDVSDFGLNLRRILQTSQSQAFPKKAGL